MSENFGQKYIKSSIKETNKQVISQKPWALLARLFVLVAALAWNEAIKTLFPDIFRPAQA